MKYWRAHVLGLVLLLSGCGARDVPLKAAAKTYDAAQSTTATAAVAAATPSPPPASSLNNGKTLALIADTFASGRSLLQTSAPAVWRGGTSPATFEKAVPELQRAGMEITQDAVPPGAASSSLDKVVSGLLPANSQASVDLLGLKLWTDACAVAGYELPIPYDHASAAALRDPLLLPFVHLGKSYALRVGCLLNVGSPEPDLHVVIFGGSEAERADALSGIQQSLIERRLHASHLPPEIFEKFIVEGVPHPVLAVGLKDATDAQKALLGRLENAGGKIIRSEALSPGPPPAPSATPLPNVPRQPGSFVDPVSATAASPIWTEIFSNVQPVIQFDAINVSYTGLSNAPLRPDDKISSGEFPLRQNHRIIEQKHFFWLCNPTDQRHVGRVIVRGMTDSASKWNCETGAIEPVPTTFSERGAHLTLSFEPFESYWLGFDRPADQPVAKPAVEQWLLATIDGPWKVRSDASQTFAGSTPPPAELQGGGLVIQFLQSWAGLKLDDFIGSVDFETQIQRPDRQGAHVWLDLGKTGGPVEVKLNGDTAGERAWPPYRFDITDKLHDGINTLNIRVIRAGAAGEGFTGPVQLLGRNSAQ